MFKKQNWSPYGRKAIYLDIKAKDKDEQVIDAYRLEKNKDIDKKRILNLIKRKHGFDLNSRDSKEEQKPEKEIEEEKNKEKDWLDKDIEW